jgi:hypothetical protein
MGLDAGSLDPRVKDSGRLVNLLQGTDVLTVNEDWFADPFGVENVGGVGKRPDILLQLLADFIGDPVAESPMKGFDWYPVQLDGKDTGLNVVMSHDAGAAGSARLVSGSIPGRNSGARRR